MRKLFVLNIFIVLIVLFACSDPETPVSAVDAGDLPSLTGPYLGQEPPGQEPELFAPGLVSTGAQELSICFSPAGDEVYFFVCGPTFNPRIILHSRRQDSTWTTPRETGFFDADRTDSYPFVAPDGERIFFCSSRAAGDSSGSAGHHEIWFADRVDNGWGKPRKIDSVRNDDGFGGNDLYISIRGEDGRWGQARNLGERLNTERGEMRPFLTADGKYLFFASSRPVPRALPEHPMAFGEVARIFGAPGNGLQDIYWVGTEVIAEFLQP